ncbi:hypothetical protein JW905_17410 [bacterium]|nr:hypothetical protein [candidate division CSSED10-310 bacterium]
MKKILGILGLAALMALVVGVALGDQLIPFPYWQHGAGVSTFWSISNYGCDVPAVVTINLLNAGGSLVQSTVGTIANEAGWLVDTASWGGGWYTSGNASGFGTYDLAASADCVYLWAAVYGVLPQGQTGFTIIMPANPYGVE